MSAPVGAVSYLNSKPLIYGLEERLHGRKLILDLPSRLADRLARRELDVALIPSVEFLRGEQLSIISDACIACRGPVRSVQLLFRKPPEQVRTLALDEGSRTSRALAQVLLHQQYGITPTLLPLPIDASLESIDADALLVIGDRAMSLNTTSYVDAWDLGEKWLALTGLPFVFAMWVANPVNEILDHAAELTEALRSARDEGLERLSDIIAVEAPKYQLTPENCRRYFESELHFFLGPQELAGLDLFRSHAAELGLVPATCAELTLMPL